MRKNNLNQLVNKVLNEAATEKAESWIKKIAREIDENFEKIDHENRDEFEGKHKSRVVGVYADIDDLKNEEVSEGDMCEQCGGEMREDVCEQCGSKNEMKEDEMKEGNAFSEARCQAGCKGGNGTPITGFDGKKVTNWSEDDKKACGCKGSMKESKKVRMTESEVIDLIERLVNEEKEAVGYKETKKVLKQSKTSNDKELANVMKKLKNYVKAGSEGTFEAEPKSFPKGNGEMKKMDKKAYTPSKAVEEYIENFAYSPGMENLQYDEIQPNEEWMEKNIEGSSMTGNNPEWANAVKTDLGKKINEKRKKNLYGKEKDKSYRRVTQPVDVAGENSDDKSLDSIFSKLGESTDKKDIMVNEELNKMKYILNYNKKTQ
jgi:hypothetical protein